MNIGKMYIAGSQVGIRGVFLGVCAKIVRDKVIVKR
jgi:hypothetical protein